MIFLNYTLMQMSRKLEYNLASTFIYKKPPKQWKKIKNIFFGNLKSKVSCIYLPSFGNPRVFNHECLVIIGPTVHRVFFVSN